MKYLVTMMKTFIWNSNYETGVAKLPDGPLALSTSIGVATKQQK